MFLVVLSHFKNLVKLPTTNSFGFQLIHEFQNSSDRVALNMENMGNGFVVSFLIITPVLLVCYVLDGPEQIQQFFMEWVSYSITDKLRKYKIIRNRELRCQNALVYFIIVVEFGRIMWTNRNRYKICYDLDRC